jgi:imidazolonepropionase
MNDIGVVADGALLIHNGAIVESGPSRRIENLQESRAAREIDAAGRLVMPAFADPDAALVCPPVSRISGTPSELSLSVLSRKRLEIGAAGVAAAFARLGVLTVGAHTGYAADLRETTKILLIHRALQNRPLRIRSILSPRPMPGIEQLTMKWIPSVRKAKLASILELRGDASRDLRSVAAAAAGAGYSLRIRSEQMADETVQQLAMEGGAVAVVAPPPDDAIYADRLARIGCVQVFTADQAIQEGCGFGPLARAVIDAGGAVALASGYGSRGYASFNPQFLLHLAATRFAMTPEEALCALTWNAACSLRMSHVTGSLEPGKYADLVIADVSDYRELERRAGHTDIQMVMRAGQVVYKRAAIMGVE